MSRTARDLRDAYASLPKIDCQRKCQIFCGPIAMTKAELDAARKLAPVAAKHTIDGYFQPEYDPVTLTCSLLTPTGSCGIYAARPGICRLFGLVKKLPCLHGCEPERWLTDDEAQAFMERVERAGK